MFREILGLVWAICFCIDPVHLKKYKTPIAYEEHQTSSKYDNPGQFRDRWKNKGHHNSPALLPDQFTHQFKKPFNPMWTDYCDPWHCNDYHKPACGLHRDTMKFRWFQSGCHIALNNLCAEQNGNLKYDTVSAEFCTRFVMFGRDGCPTTCASEPVRPICAASVFDEHVVLFKNQCSLDRANCDTNEYEVVHMQVCELLSK